MRHQTQKFTIPSLTTVTMSKWQQKVAAMQIVTVTQPSTTSKTRQRFSGHLLRQHARVRNSVEIQVLQVTVDNTENPLSVFQLFLTEDILNVIGTETNRRAAQLMSQTGVRPQSRLNNWTDVCINELLPSSYTKASFRSQSLICTGPAACFFPRRT